EAWSEDLAKDLERSVRVPEEYDQEEAFDNLEEFVEEGRAEDITVIAHTNPVSISVPKKKPEVMELALGGDSVEGKWEYSREILGDSIEISDVFDEGNYSDVFGVTKGKGTEGPVQRWGVKIQNRKVQQAERHTGVLYHQRMEYNKRILKIASDGEDVVPDGGFLRYGEIESDYILLKGSVPGPAKRMIFLRTPLREKEGLPTSPPTITYIDTSSQQGG
ncbi:MAG: 50S ribosomal protein L3, partial [Candidatus Aenigmatarchaeota archaeon]